MSYQSEWDQAVVEVDDTPPVLTSPQISRVLGMMEVLRDPINLMQIAEIKENLNTDNPDYFAYARGMFSEFTEDEQRALWVAPTKGGIFTTEERKRLRNQE